MGSDPSRIPHRRLYLCLFFLSSLVPLSYAPPPDASYVYRQYCVKPIATYTLQRPLLQDENRSGTLAGLNQSTRRSARRQPRCATLAPCILRQRAPICVLNPRILASSVSLHSQLSQGLLVVHPKFWFFDGPLCASAPSVDPDTYPSYVASLSSSVVSSLFSIHLNLDPNKRRLELEGCLVLDSRRMLPT